MFFLYHLNVHIINKSGTQNSVILVCTCTFCKNVRQTYKYEHSNDKEKTFSKWFTNVHKQLQTFVECLCSVRNCLLMFVNHLLDVFSLSFECSYLYVCLTFAECSCAYKKLLNFMFMKNIEQTFIEHKIYGGEIPLT